MEIINGVSSYATKARGGEPLRACCYFNFSSLSRARKILQTTPCKFFRRYSLTKQVFGRVINKKYGSARVQHPRKGVWGYSTPTHGAHGCDTLARGEGGHNFYHGGFGHHFRSPCQPIMRQLKSAEKSCSEADLLTFLSSCHTAALRAGL